MKDPILELDRMRELFAAADAPQPAARGCPTEEEIWMAVSGRLSRARLGEVIDHALACDACGTVWRLAREMAAEAADGREAPAAVMGTVSRKGLLRSRSGWLMAAAAIMLVMSAVVWQLRRGETPFTSEFRSGDQGTIESLLPADRPLPRAEPVLRWSGPEGARYDLRVATADLKVLATARDLQAREYRLPAEKVAALPGGAELLWQVEATTPDGRRITSKTFVTRLQ